MKKLFLTLALILTLVFALAACNDSGVDGEHVYQNEWTSDDEKHWVACIDLNCDIRKNEAYHTFGERVIDEGPTCVTPGTKHHVCLVCGKSVSESIPVDTNAHNYASDWTSDGTNHWHKCQNSGCSSKKDETSHSFGEWIVITAATCTKAGTRYHSCAVCNKAESESIPVDKNAHNYYAYYWTSDVTNHWHKCQNNGCSSVSGKTTHTFGRWIIDEAATCVKIGTRHHICTICSKSASETYSDTTAHNYATAWTTDDTNHWHKCQNSGCASVSDKTTHSWDEENTCTSCQRYKDSGVKFTKQSDGTYCVSDYKGSASEVIIPSVYNGCAVTSISDRAFEYCDSLTSITIPDSVTSIGEMAFFYCRYLTSVNIPDGVTSIGNYAFGYCESLTSISVGENSQLTSIGEMAFALCRSLTSITIPDSMTYIGRRAFGGSMKLTTISFDGTKAQWNNINKDIFWNENTSTITVYCTNGNVTEKYSY